MSVALKTRFFAHQKRHLRQSRLFVAAFRDGAISEATETTSGQVPTNSSVVDFQRRKCSTATSSMFPMKCTSKFSAVTKTSLFSRTIGSNQISNTPTAFRPYVTKSFYEDVFIPKDVDLFTFLGEKLDSFKDLPFEIDGLTGRVTTHSEIRSSAASVGSALRKRGLGVDDVVCICAHNCVEFIAAMLACVAVGAAASPVNTANTANELKAQMKLSSAKFLLITADLLDVATGAIEGDPDLQHVVLIVISKPQKPSQLPSYAISFDDLLQDNGDAFPSSEERRRLIPDPASQVALLPFSSGTTGLPKGVQLTHFNLIANLAQISTHPELMGPIDDGSRDRALALLPMWHIYLTFVSMTFLRNGTMMVTLPKFEPVSLLETISTYKLGLLPLVPPLILFLNKHPMVKGYDLSNVRDIVSAAAPLCEHLQKDVAEQFGITRFRQAYGMTELSPVVTMGRTTEWRPGTGGVIVPNTQIKIVPVDEDDDSKAKQLVEGDVGEIVVKGPQIMKGYLNNPSATAQMITADGWLHTGDIGKMNDGHLQVVDRVKELIKYKGHQVAPAELESLLLFHPYVADAAVIGVDDPVGGEVPRAYVVLKPGVNADADANKNVQQFVDERVNPFSRLRGGVEILEAIPKSASGKILRRQLRDKVAAEKQNIRS